MFAQFPTSSTLSNRSVPFRAFSGMKGSLEDLVTKIKMSLREESEMEVGSWVAREMHATTPMEISSLFDTAIQCVLDETPELQRFATIRHLDELRTEVSQCLKYEAVQEKDSVDDIVAGVLSAVSVYNRDLLAHMDAVGVLSSRIALALGCEPEFAKKCLVIGKLHDIGKIAVSPLILMKRGKLNPRSTTTSSVIPRSGIRWP